MSERRKVQLTGGSTFIVSLPINWVRGAGLEAGDSVILAPQNKSSLLISSDTLNKNQRYETKIEINRLIPKKGKMYNQPPVAEPEDIFRILISHYLAGYDIIKMESKEGFSAADRKFIKDASRKRLVGLEVVEESHHELVLQSLLNYRDLSLHRALQNMSGLLTSMLSDIMEAIEKNDKEVAQDIILRDNEVDRFYLLTVRQLKAAIEDRNLSKKIGIERPGECLGYRLVTKSMERIGDHVVRIAKNLIEMENEVEPDDPIFKMAEDVQTIFKQSIALLSNLDPMEANMVIKNAKNISRGGTALYKNRQADTNSHQFGFIVESLQRIAEYSGDIAEISINMSTKDLNT